MAENGGRHDAGEGDGLMRTYTVDQTITHIIERFQTDRQTATWAYRAAASYLRNDWAILDQADYDEIMDAVSNVTGLDHTE